MGRLAARGRCLWPLRNALTCLRSARRERRTQSPGCDTICVMSPTTDVRGVARHQRISASGFAMWTSLAGALAFCVPWLTFYMEPNDSSPWWTTWIPVGVWLLTATFGAAWVLAGGRVRRIGAALILGDALGFVLFVVSVLWAFNHTNIGWD